MTPGGNVIARLNHKKQKWVMLNLLEVMTKKSRKTILNETSRMRLDLSNEMDMVKYIEYFY